MRKQGYDNLISGWERLLAAVNESPEMFQGWESQPPSGRVVIQD